MRVLPNRAKSNRSSERIRRGPHARTHLLWQILLGSLILDPLLPLVVTPQIPVDIAVGVATICAIGALPFLAQGAVHRTLSTLRHLHHKRLAVGSRVVPLSLALSAGTIIVIKAFLLVNLPPIVVVVIVLMMLLGSRKYIKQVQRQGEEDKALFASNPWAKVQRWEQQVIIVATLPLILARAISVCGALAALPPDEESLRVVFIVVSALFLGMLRPDRSFFVGMCKRCQHPVPIVFKDIGSCLNCDLNLQRAYYAWVHRLPPSHLGGNTPAGSSESRNNEEGPPANG